MRSVVMIPDEAGFHLGASAREVARSIRPSAYAFLAHCPVEAFNRGLLILLVQSGTAMPVATGAGLSGNGPFDAGPPSG